MKQAKLDLFEVGYFTVFFTGDGNFPISDQMILWTDGEEVSIGGYDTDAKRFWEGDGSLGTSTDEIECIFWSYLPSLEQMYDLQKVEK